VEALQKLKRGELSTEEADAALDPLTESWIKKAQDKLAGGAVMATSGSNSFSAATLREWAQFAGVRDDDPLLTRALKARERADSNWTSGLEMTVACLAFMKGHFEIKDAWPPDSGRIEELLRRLENGKAKDVQVEEFRRLADRVFQDWQPEYSPAFKKRIESSLNLLGPATREN
jgi:hypothetical protein